MSKGTAAAGIVPGSPWPSGGPDRESAGILDDCVGRRVLPILRGAGSGAGHPRVGTDATGFAAEAVPGYHHQAECLLANLS